MFSCRTGTRTWRAEGLDSVGCPCNHAARAPLLSVSLGLIKRRRISRFCSCDVSTGGRAVRVPRTPGVVKKNELPTSAGKWFRQQCDAEDEVGDAFRDLLACGMGWTETRLDFEDNPEGDPLEMVWDRGAKSETWSTRGACRTCRLIRPARSVRGRARFTGKSTLETCCSRSANNVGVPTLRRPLRTRAGATPMPAF